MRSSLKYSVDNTFPEKLLHWASSNFSRVCYLNGNKQYSALSETELLVAVDAVEEIIPDADCFSTLKKFHGSKNDWLFGFFSYDLKNETENLYSKNEDKLHFPLLHFLRPRYIFRLEKNNLEVLYLKGVSTEDEIKKIIKEITLRCRHAEPAQALEGKQAEARAIAVKNNLSKQDYLTTVQKIKQHIQLGDIYEMNFCQEFYSENTIISPAEIYQKLNSISPTPFSAYYRTDDKYALCASPERFIKKTGNKIISQPIKGTRKRGMNEEEDLFLKKDLLSSEKEKSENVMIVDLVRNDLSRSARRGSVKVEELFGIYSFPQVHQMISSISSELSTSVHFVDAIKYAFPMGSMTGAPKIRAMELIEQFEKTKRGLYSGAIGYITPDGDFDFNVVIRSILYNSTEKYLSFITGGAITANSEPEQEYEECLLKAEAMMKAMAG